jgi:hypothetical protein
MDVSRWPDVCDALVVQMRATAGYRDPFAVGATASLVPVFDGPTYALTEDHATSFLAFGVGGEPTSPSSVGDVRWSVATTGNAARDEVGSIECRVIAQTGETAPVDFSTLTRQAFLIVGDVMALLRANPTLGLVAQRMFVEFDRVGNPMRFISRGPVVRLDFTVKFSTRIVI